MRHLTEKELVTLAEGKPSGPNLESWERHIQTCERCERQFEEWQAILQSMQGPDLKSVSDSARKKAMEIFRTLPMGEYETIVAHMLSDVVEPTAMGLRGETETQQILLRTEALDIQVNVYGTEKGRLMVGQLLSRSGDVVSPGTTIHLCVAGETIDTATTNTFGEFQFQNVQAGAVSLEGYLQLKTRLVARFVVKKTDNS